MLLWTRNNLYLKKFLFTYTKKKRGLNYLRADYKASKHPEFVQNLVLKPWTRKMYLNYISFKKKKTAKAIKIKLSSRRG